MILKDKRSIVHNNCFSPMVIAENILGDQYRDSVALDQIQQVFMTDKKHRRPLGEPMFSGVTYWICSFVNFLFFVSVQIFRHIHIHWRCKWCGI